MSGDPLTDAERHDLAYAMVNGQAFVPRNPPTAVDLANAIATVSIAPQRTGAAPLTIVLLDRKWTLYDSGFFDPNDDGRLDPVLINWPRGSRRWWVLNQVTPAGAARTLTLTFIPRLAWAMMNTFAKGVVKANRASANRAQFLKMLTLDAARQHGFDAEFYCSYLDATEPIAKVSQQSTSASGSQGNGEAHKTNGLTAQDTDLTCRGVPLTAPQKRVVNIALGECAKQNAPTIVAEAMIYAGMGESSLSETDTWQNSTDQDTATEAREWLQGGSGFQQGGGIACARANPHYVAWQIANAVEANAVWDGKTSLPAGSDSYAHQVDPPTIAEAQAIVQAGGFNGAQSGTFEVKQPFFFKVGTSSTPNESYFATVLRLSQEVNWDYIIDGDRAYYDSELTLIKQKSTKVLRRDDDEVADWGGTWESRNIATNVSLTLIVGMFDLWPGEVVRLLGKGALATGSTCGLPGRWLVDSIQRDKSSSTSIVALVQPTRPKAEPAPTVKTVSVSGGDASSIANVEQLRAGSVDRVVAASQVLSNMMLPYVWGGGHTAGALDEVTKAAIHGLDCSGSVCWVLHHAGMFPGTAAIFSGDLDTWGLPGPGDEVTVYCNNDHTFIHIHPKGSPDMQMNTSYSNANGLPAGSGPQYFPWGQNGEADANSGAFTARHWPGT